MSDHHNTCLRGERCLCYLTGYTDAEYDHGHALDTLKPVKSEVALVEELIEALKEWQRIYDIKGLAADVRNAMKRHAAGLTREVLHKIKTKANSHEPPKLP